MRAGHINTLGSDVGTDHPPDVTTDNQSESAHVTDRVTDNDNDEPVREHPAGPATPPGLPSAGDHAPTGHGSAAR